MNTYRYNLISMFYFRYVNFALSFILLTYFVVQIIGVGRELLLLIPAAINILMVYALNKYYINTYKTLPFVIKAEGEKLIASNFMFRKTIVEIKYSDIDEITGGVFGFNPKGLIYVHDGEQNQTITIHPNIENVDPLLKTIIMKVNDNLRDELIKKLKQRED